MGMTESQLRKTIPVQNLTMQELLKTDPLGVFTRIAQESDGKVQAMEEKAPEQEWEDEPTREAAPFTGTDPINPEHYKSGGLEVIQVIEAFGLDYHRASALKYLLRAGRKDDELQDLKKCAWFINRSIQKLEGK